MREINSSIRSRIIHTFDYLIETGEDRERYGGCINAMWRQCIEMGAFGYSAHYEAMIGDWQYDYELQRTISVDIRYCLFITEKFGGAGFLLDEMGVTRQE